MTPNPQPPQGDEDDEDLEHGRAHSDMWRFDLKQHTARGGGGGGGAGPAAGGGRRAAGAGWGEGGRAGRRARLAGAAEPPSTTTARAPQWERVKKAGMAPGPRASFAWAVHKGTRVFLFGGVSDNEAKGGEDLSSEFHNDLYTFSFGNQ